MTSSEKECLLRLEEKLDQVQKSVEKNAKEISDLKATVNMGKGRSEEHTSELQSRLHLVCRLLLEKKNKIIHNNNNSITRSIARTAANRK